MNQLFQKISMNLCGVHIVDDDTPVTHTDADCDHFRAVKAIGGDVVIASFDAEAEITGVTTDITLNSGDTLLVKFKTITLDASTTGKAVLSKFIN